MPQLIMGPPASQPWTSSWAFHAGISAVETWIADLPLANVSETHRQVLNALTKINAVELTHQQRFKALELFRGPIRYLNDALTRQFLGAPLPLSAKADKAAALLQGLQTETAKGYQCIGDDLLNADNLRQDFAILTGSLYRALYFLGQALVTGYQAYRPAAPDLWRTIHRIYSETERKGLQNSAVKDFYCHDQETSIEARYKQILLLALADPNRLTQTDMAHVEAALEHWVSLCSISTADHSYHVDNMYTIDIKGDSPPTYLVYSGIRHYGSCRLLDTTALIQTLRDLLTQSLDDLTKSKTNSRGQQVNAPSKDLLQRLLSNWGIPSKRRFTRSKRDREAFEIGLGLNNCYRLLGGTPLSNDPVSFTLYPPSRARVRIAVSGDGVSCDSDDLTCSCTLVNESADGACMEWRHPATGKMRIGDVIALRNVHPPQRSWNIAVIRWIKILGHRSLEFGIQLLAPDAVPVAIRLYTENETGRDYLNSLLLPELRATRQPESLIVPACLYHVGDEVSLNMEHRALRLKLGKTLETNQTYSRFLFSRIS